MRLVLRATEEAGGAAEERRLDLGTLTLGRGSDNDWTIPDPERTLSKRHCRIDRSGDGYVITDQSTNGVFINDSLQPIGRGRSCSLADGDVVTLGPVRIVVTIEPDQPAPVPPAPLHNRMNAADDASYLEAERPALAAGPAPFTGLPQSPGFPIPVPSGAPWLDGIPGGEFGPDRHVQAQGWDAPPDPAEFAASGVRVAAHPLDPAPASFSHGSEHAPADATVMRVPTAQTVLPTDWNDADPLAGATLAPSPLQALEDARPSQANAARAIPLESVAIPAEMPSMTGPPEPGPEPRPAVPGAAGPAGNLFLDAFLEAADLPQDALSGAGMAEAGRKLGLMLRDAVEGLRDILATRAMVKSELRVSQTVIQAADNNALKFAPDVRRCLAAMVGQPPRGFLPGPEAMQGALDDIKRHELALIAALNSVFAAMTEKLDPEAIAAKVRAEAGIGTMLPFAREARCWAMYLEHHQAFQVTGSENTAGSLLAPLAAAYARQLRRAEAPAAPPSARDRPQDQP